MAARQPSGQAIHVLADHLPTDQTRQVQQHLDSHPTAQMHFTLPKPWLHPVEMWFAQKERDGIIHETFISVQDRDRRLSTAMMDSRRQTNEKGSRSQQDAQMSMS